jgi:hypothetical protein
MGISSAVRLAACMPAMRATSSGFPFGLAGKAASTAADNSTKAEAVAVRRLSGFALTSTMLACPALSKWERLALESRGLEDFAWLDDFAWREGLA